MQGHDRIRTNTAIHLRPDFHTSVRRFDRHPVPTALNPLGVKGAGECGTVGGLAATMNAINDALAPLGIRNMTMPCTPHRLWQAIRTATGKAA